MKEAYFAGGCFWCISSAFQNIDGIIKVESGYAGSNNIDVNYKIVKSQTTDYKETIKIIYDESIISFEELFNLFISNVDPFDDGGQYIDRGSSYKLAAYIKDEKEEEIVEKVIKQIEQQFNKKAYIDILKFDKFVSAEEEHQDYALKNPKAFLTEIIESGRSTQINIKKGAKILFIGDSVTAYGRDYNEFASIGKSYAKMLADEWQDNATCYNTSVSGRKVRDVLDHFDEEVVRVNPDYAFVLIGVNDTWHGFPSANNPLPKFMEEYNYSIFANATVDIAVKLPQGEDLEEYNEIFMFYLYYFIGSSRYSPKDEYCPCLNGSIYYLNEKTDIETVTSENLRDKKFVKENSIKVFEFRIAGDEYKESENE